VTDASGPSFPLHAVASVLVPSGPLQDAMSNAPQEERPEGRASDVPTDLIKEREVFVRTFLQKGVELTEQLLHENEELRQRNAELHSHNARLRAQVASDDAIRDLLRTVETLEKERGRLLAVSTELQQTKEQEERRYSQIEHELNDLANLYIASHQLHASLSVRRVVRQLRDMLEQLMGGSVFAIYLMDQPGKEAVPIGHQGFDEADVKPVVVGEGPVGEACLTGIPRIREDGPLTGGSMDNPVAVIPMLVDGRPVGAISLVSMLEQKEGWASVDRELFSLLGRQAGTALIAANLYDKERGPVAALAGLMDKLNSQRA
jgi:hypothetical protein